MKDKAKLDQITSFYQMIQNTKTNKDHEQSPIGKLLNLKQEEKEDTSQEIKNIKSELNNLTQFLQQSMMNKGENTSYAIKYDQEGLNGTRKSSFGSSQIKPPDNKTRSSFFISKAVQNSTSLWCNIKANIGSIHKTNEQ